jgi:putative nucleotidyltransferase with HDIG domain
VVPRAIRPFRGFARFFLEVYMIDLEACKKIFKDYVNNYNMNNEKIYLKYYHTMNVMNFCEQISLSLNLSDDDKSISMLIGLLHDIGRFEQIKVYNTFRDKDSINHAEYGVRILKENNFIDRFVSDKKIQNIVLTAIENHNKFKIDDNLDDRTEMFSKIIRDADKLDIFRIFVEEQVKLPKNDSKISENILSDLINKKVCLDKDMESEIDYHLRHIGMFLDLNYKYSLNYVKENKMADKLIDRIIDSNESEKDNLNKIRASLNEFFEGC